MIKEKKYLHSDQTPDIIIFEDDPAFSSYLQNIIKKSGEDFHIALTTDNLEALQRYIELLEKPAIFLLDIMFGNKSDGFIMADIINCNADNATIVFITAYPEKILSNSFYKLKSLNVILKTSKSFELEIIQTLTEAVQRTTKNNIHIYSDKFTTILISIDDIFFIESIKSKNKIKIHHHSGTYEMRTSLQKIVSQLPDNFVRCHNSYIVNTRKILKIDYVMRTISMNNGGICYYSVLQKNKLLKMVNQQSGG